MCTLSLTDITFDISLNVPTQEKMQLMAPVSHMGSLNGIVLTLKGKANLKDRIGGNIEGCVITFRGNIFFD